MKQFLRVFTWEPCVRILINVRSMDYFTAGKNRIVVVIRIHVGSFVIRSKEGLGDLLDMYYTEKVIII